MKKLLYLLLLLGSMVNSQWVTRQYLPYYISSCFVNGTNTCFAVSDNSCIRKSTDGGITWQNQAGNYANGFADVFFANQNTGWASGQGGILRSTTNGGANWFPQSSGTNYDLAGIHFVNASTGFICSIGNVIMTTNGGNNWSVIPVGGNQYRDIQFINQNTGIVCGASGSIHTTTNSGLNWTAQLSGTNEILNTVKYFPVGTCFIGTSGGKILKSTNYGVNWIIINTGTTEEITSLCNLNNGFGFFCTAAGKIFRTTDSGTNWSQVHSAPGVWLTSMSVPDLNGTSLFAFGYNGFILRSTNSGVNWTVLDGNIYSETISSVSFPDQQTGYACDYSGTVYRSTNSGFNWQVNSFRTDCSAYKMNFVSPSTGFMAGDSINIPVFWKTTNAAATWERLPITGLTGLQSFFFASAQTGFAGGTSFAEGGYTILRTTNAGAVWSTVFSAAFLPNDIYFLNTSTGWICCNDGVICKTTNSGINWSELNTPVSSHLLSVFFVNASTGFTCGDSGRIMRSTNGGSNWSLLQSGTTNTLYSVHFGSALNGCAAGGNGSRLVTTNGGVNWLEQSDNSGVDLYSAFFSSANSVYASGENGMISYLDISLVNTVNSGNNVPESFILHQNYPNPFNPSTLIRFEMAESGIVDINVFDITGRIVSVLLHNKFLSTGTHSVLFDAAEFSSGVYFYRAEISGKNGTITNTKKMILLK